MNDEHQYTPTTAEVREVFAAAGSWPEGSAEEAEAQLNLAFDRWLVAHDAEVRQEQADHDAERINDLDTQLAATSRALAEFTARAGVVAEELEWEYGISSGCGSVNYIGSREFVEEKVRDWQLAGAPLRGAEGIVRRRKVGLWVSVERVGETDE